VKGAPQAARTTTSTVKRAPKPTVIRRMVKHTAKRVLSRSHPDHVAARRNSKRRLPVAVLGKPAHPAIGLVPQRHPAAVRSTPVPRPATSGQAADGSTGSERHWLADNDATVESLSAAAGIALVLAVLAVPQLLRKTPLPVSGLPGRRHRMRRVPIAATTRRPTGSTEVGRPAVRLPVDLIQPGGIGVIGPGANGYMRALPSNYSPARRHRCG
jgi:hypothetical protein